MKKRIRIRHLVLDRLRQFHDDKTGHVHVGTRSYQSYEDFAEATSNHQSANSTSSMEEFRQATADTAQLRQNNAPAESARPSTQAVVETPADARSAPPKESQTPRQNLSNPVRDSFAANTAAPESHPVERFQVPRVFIQTPRSADTPSPTARADIVANRPTRQSPSQEAARKSSAGNEARPGTASSAAQSFHSTESSVTTATGTPDNIKTPAAPPQTPAISVRPEVQAPSSKANSLQKTTWTPNLSGNPTTESGKAAPNLSYAAKTPTPNGSTSEASLKTSAHFISTKLLAPSPDQIALASLSPQQAKALPVAVGAWLNGFPLVRGPESSMLLAVEKKLLRFGEILFGRYALASKLNNKSLSDPSLLAELGLLWMLWKKKNLRSRANKTKFRSESDRAEASDETKQDDNPEHGRENAFQAPQV